tara:strand:- start:524 stop:631 length:108 start_codon:yes stop_codon:yes gene_type:complete
MDRDTIDSGKELLQMVPYFNQSDHRLFYLESVSFA